VERKIINHLKLDSCDSTQEELKLEAPLEAYTLISTLLQHKGAGRYDRQWTKQSHSLAFSFTAPAHKELSWHSLQTAVLVHDWILDFFQIETKLKWPNDILNLSGKKIGGLLHDHLQGMMMIGIGINLHSDSKDEYPSLLKNPPFESQHDLALSCTQFILNQENINPTDIKSRWEKSCFHLNKNVTVEDAGKKISGKFVGLGSWGEALIETSEGLTSVYSGSLRF
jgi:BirA family transcriptional regulator, biotin operon repressor / biotin---[acetyl-CoA-carboxylase] ligase